MKTTTWILIARRQFSALLCVLAAGMLVAMSGCQLPSAEQSAEKDFNQVYYQYASTQLEYPDVQTPFEEGLIDTPAPLLLNEVRFDESEVKYTDLTLQDAVKKALENSTVLRDIGGTLLKSPTSMVTIHDVAIQESDPRYGVAAALSAFDASFATNTFVEQNDKALNNSFFGGGTRQLKQDVTVIESQLTKQGVTGTQFSSRMYTEYDSNNAPGNLFPSAWNVHLETEIRHPLLQGGGVEFNRIAGPSETPGVVNGVLLARMNTDISLADFEIGVRDFVSNVENAYWDLYFAYRDLDAKIQARDSALATWRRINALKESGRRGGEAEKEAQAREQYFRFQEQVHDALAGRLIEGTRSGNGSGGGTFRGSGGVHTTERRLRLLMGLAISDGSVIRPIDDPILARVIFDWDTILVESLTRRCELRKQKWLVKRREKELEASKNFLMPRLDLIGRYRWRGFGRDLLEQHDGPKFSGGGVPTESQFNNAWGNLLGGNFQEWQLGFEFSVPLGNRRGHAAVRNSELLLARERAILKEQEREVVHNLTNAIAEASRAYVGVETNLNRKIAADDQLKAVQAAFDVDRAPLDLVLDAQRRVADAETNYFRARTEYGLAIKNVHFAKGSLLDYNEVYLSEGMWPVKAYYDAAERRERLSRPLDIFKMLSIPDGVSAGVFPQLIEPTRDDDDQDAPKLDQQVPPAPIENPASDNSETAEVKEVASPRPLGEGPSSRRPSASARSSAKDKSFIHNKPVPLGSWNESDVPIVPSATDKSSATPVGENELLKSISAGINEQPLRENGSE